MENKKSLLLVVGIIVIVVTFIGVTYAFFQAQGGNAVVKNVHVLTHTTDTLTFSVSDDIDIEIDTANFTNSGTNQSGSATASAILSPNSKTGSASKDYYVYLAIVGNEIDYCSTNTNQDPELMLQVYDDSNQLVTLTGLGNQKTVNGVTGYDLTGVTGLIPLLDSHTISASNNATTAENWRVVITVINLGVNQNENAGKQVNAKLLIQEDEIINPSTITFSYPAYTSCTDVYCALNELYGAI